MICPECREAGKWLRKGDTQQSTIHHRRCRGGTWCECQHSTDTKAIRELVTLPAKG